MPVERKMKFFTRYIRRCRCIFRRGHGEQHQPDPSPPLDPTNVTRPSSARAWARRPLALARR